MFKRLLKGRAVPPATPRKPTAAQVRIGQDQRMATLAMELGVAGAQTLVEEFGFTNEQAQRWFDLMLTRAIVNRAEGAKATVDGWKPKAKA